MEEGHIHNKLVLHRLLSKIKKYGLRFIINGNDNSYWEWEINYEDQTQLLLISFRLPVLFIPELRIEEKLSNLNQMKASANGNIFRVTGHLGGEFTGHRWIPPHKGQWRGA